jgi:plasmid stability protein
MAQLILDNVEEELVRALEVRAASKGHSPEEELREIVKEALAAEPEPERPSFRDLLGQMPNVGEDEDFARAPDPGRPPVEL